MTTSIWQTYTKPGFPVATENIRCATCIVGTGIGGMTAAYLLAKAGIDIIVVTDEEFAAGESSKTTAQINTIHDDTWTEMKDIHGLEGIKICAQGYKDALQFIRDTVKKESIECNLETVSSYTFPVEEKDRDILYAEYKLAGDLGFNVKLTEHHPGFRARGPILVYHDQAQFHPIMYLAGLAHILSKMPNVRMYTNVRVLEVDDQPKEVTLSLNTGGVILADSVIMATNVPTHLRFIPHDALAPYRSYVIALPVKKQSIPYGQYADTADPYHYVRVVQNNRKEYGIDPDFDCLLVGGEDHRVGQAGDSDKIFARLYTWASDIFPIEQDIAYKWSAQTIETFDGMPFIGLSPSGSKNVYIITGDSGTGMTHATMGGIITSDLVLGRDNYMSEFFSPSRSRTKSIKRWISENAASVSTYTDWVTPGDVNSEDEIKPGTGCIIRQGLNKCAVYKSVNGDIKRFSAVCPHLNAVIRWNPVEHTWDCPAHGSRFDVDGQVLNGPAATCLGPIEKEK